MYSNQTIPKYFQQWMRLYKKDAVRDVTYRKYESTLRWLRRLCLRVTLRQLDRPLYQSIINAYAQSHEQSTVMEFHLRSGPLCWTRSKMASSRMTRPAKRSSKDARNGIASRFS